MILLRHHVQISSTHTHTKPPQKKLFHFLVCAKSVDSGSLHFQVETGICAWPLSLSLFFFPVFLSPPFHVFADLTAAASLSPLAGLQI